MDTKNQNSYTTRINNAINFINNNLDKELNLAVVAKVAYYSPFHFHRIFSALVGESPNAYIHRKRIEKSASSLIHHPGKTISDIAIENGFSSNAAYCKAFKKFYGVTPTAFKNATDAFSKIRQIDSKNEQKELEYGSYFSSVNNLKHWISMTTTIEIKQMPKMDLAYVSHVGAFNQIGNAYGKLMRWAGPKGLIGSKTVTVYHDNPNVTTIDKVRQSASIMLEAPVKADAEVALQTVEASKCAVGHFEIGFDEFEKAWQSVFVWINENGYESANKDCYEIYHNDFNTHPEKKSIIDICVPVN